MNVAFYRDLGRSGMQVSALGVGRWAIGGPGDATPLNKMGSDIERGVAGRARESMRGARWPTK
jgi:aryl-alcohol dehydrogenase-like predicted oxidoreductase